MSATKQACWLFGILMILAISGWYFAANEKKSILTPQQLQHSFDTQAKNLEVRQYNEKGQLTSLLKAPVLHHLPHQDTHIITKPRIIISQAKQPDWVITAKQAFSVNNNSKITLKDNVVIIQQDQKAHETSRFTTEQLIWLPHEKKITTDKKIRFEQAGTIVTSVGMIGWLNDKKVQLLHHAKGFYNASKTP